MEEHRRHTFRAEISGSRRTASYYREERFQSDAKDPIAVRLTEKRCLRALLDAVGAAVEFIPKETNSYTYGPLPIKKNLKEAVQAVREWLAANGEEDR
jgi:hypothetical protein